jgi:hypothetical protein
MEKVTLKSWADFEAKVASLTEKPQHLQPLFRGQRPVRLNEKPECRWPLDTSLEKYGAVNYPVKEYHKHLLVTAEAIESVTGKRWELREYIEQADNYSHSPQEYRFMAFLRQNGFPSPLLDWTRSPYVAAFFAFQRADPKDGEFVAIFEYLEDTGYKNICPGAATIRRCGPWIGTDKKHFLQQSDYTVCRKGENSTLLYARHDEVFEKPEEEQDILIRYLIPVSERKQVLQKLRLMNITPYSLFETIEKLLELIASDVIHI